MKQIKTLSNSFALIETDGNGKVLTQFGFRKGGLSYFIRNNNVKFYLTEDFFYKNVVWSADAPLMIDGIPYDIDALPDALKKIFILEDEGGGGGITVDQTLSTASTNPIGNQAVAHAVDDLDEAVSDRYTKTETNSLLDTKLDVSAYTPTDLSQYWTSGETQSAITQSLSGYATEQWVENQGYLTEHQSLDEYYTKSETDGVVNGAVSGKADTSAVTAVDDALTAHTADTSVHVTSQEKAYWNNKLDASAYTPTDLSNYYTKGQTDDLLDDKLDVTAYTPTDLSNYYTKGETDGVVNGAVSGKADTSAVTQEVSSAVAPLFGAVEYDSQTQRINFKHDATGQTIAYVDATDFIKDGMVSNVEIANGNLVITFNSDAGKQPISIPLTDIFDPANYYTTAQTQSYVSGFTYDKATIDQKVAEGGTFDPDLYYDKTATNALLAAKADTATTYTKTEVDAALSGKADTSAVTTVNDALTAHTANTSVHVTAAEKTYWNNKLDASAYTPTDLSQYWTSAQTQSAIDDAISGITGGTGVTVDSALSSTSVNPVQNSVIYAKFDEVEQVTATALNELNDKLGDIETLLAAI